MQSLCVIEYWRGQVNLVHGPFADANSAHAYKTLRKEFVKDRDGVTLEIRVLVGVKQ